MIGRYFAAMSEPGNGPGQPFDTIREARAWAEGYGLAYRSCTIRDRRGWTVAIHSRDLAGDGLRWFATPGPY